MPRHHEARSGFTLTEVLMAMFVMAIGMISLLVLFPVAFQNAKWALDTEQVARGAANAQSMTEMPHMPVDNNNTLQFPIIGKVPGSTSVVSATAQSIRNDTMYQPSLSNTEMAWRVICSIPTSVMNARLTRDFFMVNTTGGTARWTYNTNTALSGLSLVDPTLIPGARVKLPPVFVDPWVANTFFDPAMPLPFHVGADNNVGLYDLTHAPFRFNPLNSNPTSTQVAGNANLRPNWSIGIPRFSVSQFNFLDDPLGIRKQNEFSMGDEIDFEVNGQPRLNTANTFARQRRFTWAYMCQWPSYATPEVCEVTAVVFNSRPGNSGVGIFPAAETTFANPLNFLMFTKGLTQAFIVLPSTTAAQPMNAKVGDWILDTTFILPEYDPNNPDETAPFLDQYHASSNAVLAFPQPMGAPHLLRPGLVGGHFYKILDISAVQVSGGVFFQTITIDRPARSDGFNGTILTGIADVITKSAGKMPQR